MNDKRRNSELAKIHLAAKTLRLDDATYRAIIVRVCDGKTSAAHLSAYERGQLLNEFKRLGFVVAPGVKAKASHLNDEGMAKKIRACWLDLKDAGLLSDPSEKALRAFIRRTCGVDRMEWLTVAQASLIIEGLKLWHRRWEEKGALKSGA